MTPNPTPTPLSDAEAIRCCGHCEVDDEGQAVCGITFTRQLERDLAACQEKLERARKILAVVEEELREERAAHGQFGVGA